MSKPGRRQHDATASLTKYTRPYVFDALLMLIVAIAYNIWHPGMYLPHLGLRIPKEGRATPPSAVVADVENIPQQKQEGAD
jgi:hypothetical protein